MLDGIQLSVSQSEITLNLLIESLIQKKKLFNRLRELNIVFVIYSINTFFKRIVTVLHNLIIHI